MSHSHTPSQPGHTRRGSRHARLAFTALSGLAILAATMTGLAPAAFATLPPGSPRAGVPVAPPPPLPSAPAAGFPLWVVIVVLAGAVVLSAGTTIATMALVQLRRA